jgi:hypothetical protein
MEKRAYERMPADIEVRLPYGNKFYSGTILNLSEKGMFISTKKFYPSDSMLSIYIDNKPVNLLSRVRRYRMTAGHLDGIGIEILNPQKKYLDFIDDLRSAL